MAIKASIAQTIQRTIAAQRSIAPLVVFRIIFGTLMLGATLRFILNGWVQLLYLQPKFFFYYFGFSWVKNPAVLGLPHWTVYAVYILMAAAALGIVLGWRYRLSALLFFLLFTYTELWDLTNYLNHYYFVSLIAGLMVLLPAHRSFSLDVQRNPGLARATVPAWTINILRLQLGMVYFFAGLAKLHPDWLLKAQPLRLWLSANADLPLIGEWLTYTWVAFAFSWVGALYDLFIPFLLCWRKARPLAYVAVVAFHVLTWILFPIGIFPWVMIFSTLIFFGAGFHQQLLHFLRRLLQLKVPALAATAWSPGRPQLLGGFLTAFVVFQLLFPLRYALYPDSLFWTEQGFRFSWRVMLMEKSGYVAFTILNPDNGRHIAVRNSNYLTAQQEKMMATQPDMILQFAQFLEAEYRKKGIRAPEVYASESFVSLNGRSSRPFVRPDVNLAALQDGWAPRTWLFPFDETAYRAAR